jgi:hypothetical protein
MVSPVLMMGLSAKGRMNYKWIGLEGQKSSIQNLPAMQTGKDAEFLLHKLMLDFCQKLWATHPSPSRCTDQKLLCLSG